MSIDGVSNLHDYNAIINSIDLYFKNQSNAEELSPLIKKVIQKTYDFFKENYSEGSCKLYKLTESHFILCSSNVNKPGLSQEGLIINSEKHKTSIEVDLNQMKKLIVCHSGKCDGFDRVYHLDTTPGNEGFLNRDEDYNHSESSEKESSLYDEFLKGQIKPQEQLENFSNPMTSLYRGVALTVPGLSLVSTIYFTYKSLESARKIHLEGYDRSRLLATAALICGAVLSGSVLCSSVSAWSK